MCGIRLLDYKTSTPFLQVHLTSLHLYMGGEGYFVDLVAKHYLSSKWSIWALKRTQFYADFKSGENLKFVKKEFPTNCF